MTDNYKYDLLKGWPITSVCKADIVQSGAMTEEEARKLTNDDMQQIARDMADAYCTSAFWIDLETIAERYKNNPKRTTKP